MNTQHLSNTLRQLIRKIEHSKKQQRQGLCPYHSHTATELSQVMTQQVLKPIIEDVSATVKRHISYQYGTSIGFYYLLVDGRKFAVLCIPNPRSGTIFIKPLNSHGKQCAPSSLLKNTSSIVDCLYNFDKQ